MKKKIIGSLLAVFLTNSMMYSQAIIKGIVFEQHEKLKKGEHFWPEEGKVIESAIVSLMQDSTLISQMESDSKGRISFAIFPSGKGKYQITIIHPDYEDYTAEYIIYGTITTVKYFFLRPNKRHKKQSRK